MSTRSVLLTFALLLLAPLSNAADDAAAIIRATKQHVTAEAAVNDAVVTVEKVSGDYARVKVESSSGATDPATAYLKRGKAKWKVLVLGTAFSPEDFAELGIPAAVRE